MRWWGGWLVSGVASLGTWGSSPPLPPLVSCLAAPRLGFAADLVPIGLPWTGFRGVASCSLFTVAEMGEGL